MRDNDQQLAKATRNLDDVVDQFYNAIRIYLTRLTQGALGEDQNRRCQNMLTFIGNLEHIGNIIALYSAG